MLQVQGNVPDKRLNESLLQPEPFLSLIKSFILDLKTRQVSQGVFLAFLRRSELESVNYLWRDSCQVFEMAADSVGFFDDGVHAQFGDLFDECVLITFPVLHHYGQQREYNSCICKSITLMIYEYIYIYIEYIYFFFLPRSFLRLYSLMFTLISLTACRALVSWGRSG